MASSTSPLFSSSASWSKLSMPLGFALGNSERHLVFQQVYTAVGDDEVKAVGILSVSPMRLPSMAFICWGTAEMNRSQSAPS